MIGSRAEQASGFDLVKLTPENPISPVPELVGIGFGTNATSYNLLLRELFAQRFTTLYPDFRLGSEPRRFLLPDVDQAKREAILHTIESEGFVNEKGVRQVNVIAHSKGAIDVIMVAKYHPEYFRNILLVAPGGIHPGRNSLAVLINLIAGARRNHKDKLQLAQEENGNTAERIRLNNEIGREYRKSLGLVRLVLENWTSATATIDQYFPFLQSKGVKIVIAAMNKDAWFPPAFLNPRRTRIIGIDDFVVLPGIHGAIKFVPESAQQVVGILKNMEHNYPPT